MILYTGKLTPRFIFALVVIGRIQDLMNSNVSNKLPLNTTVSGRIRNGIKLLVGVEGRKLQVANITLYTVLSSSIKLLVVKKNDSFSDLF